MPEFSVVVTDHGFPNLDPERAVLEPLGARVDGRACRTEDEVCAAVRQADAVLTQFAPVGARAIAAMERCRVIVRYGVGVDNVDLAAASARGIPVANVPDYSAAEVADHAMALLLSLVRKISAVVEQVRAGIWEIAPLRPTPGLEDMTLGLLGFGRVARGVAQRARAFGMRVIAYDPYVPPDAVMAGGAEPVGFDQLIGQADAVSIHLPLSDATRHIVDAAVLRQMKPSAYLINTSRGGLVDESALAAALAAGAIAGAGLDVLSQEPPPPDHPLLRLPHALVTSHCAWYSETSLARLQRLAAVEAARVLQGGRPQHVVNGL